jgi:foldase protein PrsA
VRHLACHVNHHKPTTQMPPLRSTRAFFPPLLLLLLTAGLLASCGGTSSKPSANAGATSSATTSASSGSSAQTTTPPPTSSSLPLGTPVARVGSATITWAMLRHEMSIGPGGTHEVPEPPSFSACVAHGGPVAPASAGAKPSGTPEQQCRKRYRELLEPALSSLIRSQWLLGEGSEKALKLNQGELQKELAQYSQGALKTQLAASGLTLADVRQNILTQQITDRLFAQVKARTPRVDAAYIARYYAAHKQSLAVPEERDLHIIRTASDGAAQKVLEEIKAGKSFAEVRKRISLPQPVRTSEGTFIGLTPKLFTETVLAHAIFRARPHVLSGPVKISLGYYVFEVLRIRPPHVQSLGEARASLQKELPEEVHHRVLAATIAAFRKKWTARTDCKAGFVVEGCRQYRMTASSPVLDRYSF